MTYRELEWQKGKLKKEEVRIYAKHKEEIKEVAAARKAAGKKWADNIMSKI